MTDAAHGGRALRFRPLKPEDEASLRELFLRNSTPETVRYFHPFPLTAETAHLLATHQGKDRYYVALRSGAVAALSMLRGWDEGYVVPSFGILVDHEWRGRGLGSAMTDFTVGQARKLGATRIRLSVHASHEHALRLYSTRGFVEDSRSRVDTPFGEDYVVVLKKELAR
jgi:ribosomal-protein-alanine N-acetyltransferase